MSIAVSNSSSEVLLSYLQKNIGTFPGVRELRTRALENFASLGIPGNKHEEFRKTPIAKAISEFTFQPVYTPADIFPDELVISGLEGYPVVFINNEFKKEQSVLPEAVTVVPMTDALQSYGTLVENHLGKYASDEQDGLIALNTAGWKNGFFIHVPQGVILDKPITVYHLITDSAIHLTRNLIVAEKNSEATLIEKTTSTNGCFISSVTEGIVEENSGLNYFIIQNNDGNHVEFNHKQFSQKDSSRVNACTVTLAGKLIRNNMNLVLNGSNCDSHMNGVYLLKDNTICDNHTIADHTQPHSQSNELYKGVLEGKSKAIFNGRIYVRPQAQKTNAFQSNRNILLSEDATIHTKPQLEIWADDVKCSHGCTSGQLDEEALFYLRTRGLGKDTARAMLLYAFIGEVIDKIPVEALRTYVNQLVSERLHKNF